MHGTILARALCGAAVLFSVVACADSPTEGILNGPRVTLRLDLVHQNGVLDSAGASGQAMVLDVLMPYDIRYREVDDFRMTRRRDGAAFEWVESVRGTRSAYSSYIASPPNWRLPWRGAGSALGLRDVVPGDTLDIVIATGRRSLVATLVVPGLPRLSVATEGGVDVARWQRVPGAAFYEVLAPSESYEPIYTSDSLLVLRNVLASQHPSPVITQVYDPATARRRLSEFVFPGRQDGLYFDLSAMVSDRVERTR